MQNKTKRFMLAGCLAASVAVTGLTGCHTEDRTAGNYLDDRLVARRIESNLNHDPVYKYSDVSVKVYQGVAQLSGFVDSRQQIERAAEKASRTEGVREVINDIAIKPQFKIIPAGQESERRYESNAGKPGANVGENRGSYNKDWNDNNTQPQRAPIVTPNQGSPATPNTGNN
jgi:hyperosmotically inducible periplasmic protein